MFCFSTCHVEKVPLIIESPEKECLTKSCKISHGTWSVNTLRPRQNYRHFAGDTFKRIFLRENVRISIEISLNFVPKSPIDNIPTLFQIMAWRRPGDKLLSEAMMVSLLTHICVARPRWVNSVATGRCGSNLKSILSEHMQQIKFLGTTCEIALRWMSIKNPLICDHWFRQWLCAVR